LDEQGAVGQGVTPKLMRSTSRTICARCLLFRYGISEKSHTLNLGGKPGFPQTGPRPRRVPPDANPSFQTHTRTLAALSLVPVAVISSTGCPKLRSRMRSLSLVAPGQLDVLVFLDHGNDLHRINRRVGL
jgi:hypothetical protein